MKLYSPEIVKAYINNNNIQHFDSHFMKKLMISDNGESMTDGIK